MKRRLFTLLFTAVLVFSWSGLALAQVDQNQPETEFSDVPPGIWYGEDVKLLVNENILKGKVPGLFYPNDNITRAELAAIFMRTAGAEDEAVQAGESFTDVNPGDWYYQYIYWAKENGVVNGYEDGTFRPNQNISRQEIAKMTMNYIKNCAKLTLPQPYTAITFFDDAKIGDWAKEEIIALQRCALLTGFDNLHFRPQENATRAQSAHIVAKVLRLEFNPTDIPSEPKYRKISGNPYKGYSRLVNRTYVIPDAGSYVPENLVTVSGSSVQMEATAAAALTEMRRDYLNSHSGNFICQSGYRSYDYQSGLYNRKINQTGSKFRAGVVSAIPGTSEHQTGLAMDISVNGSLTTSFGSTTLGQWLAANCHEYGYILRYPANKERITGITYEPWHFRYVGEEVAKEMRSQGYATLEEYYGLYLAEDDLNPYLPYLK